MDLAALLADPARVGEVPNTELVAVLEAVNAEGARLETLRSLLVARLTTVTATTSTANGKPDAADLVTDIAEVARIARRSESWIRKHGRTLPGFVQPGGRGCKVAWSRRALEAWATTPSA